MDQSLDRYRWGALAAVLVAVLGFAVWANAGEPPVCAACHADLYEGMAKAKHGNDGDARTPFGSGRACEACHGDASKHAEDPAAAKPPVLFGRGQDADAQNAACLNCHQGGNQMHWAGSAHDRSKVACADCHNPHAAKDQVLVKETQAGVCSDCHKDIRADMFRTSTHPLRSGAMTCSNCHNPHGSIADAQLVKNSVNETCAQCHADKRGPFLWEHPPARENCAECHSPHGSNNPPLLRARGPYLCQQCHANPFHPSTLYSGNNLPRSTAGTGFDKMLAANCMNCHPKVHGSNHPSGARFTR
jgi:DmsE family decaheme c-type cytochrome